MRTLKDLKLCKKSRKKVEEWLQEWLDLFIEQANHKHGWVYRANFEKDNFFFFTDCKDILEKDPEARGQENNLAIRSRKRKIMMQLFLKTLLGQNLGLITITCNHCGYRGCYIEGLKDGTGHWVFCPKCKKTDVHVFPAGYDTCMDTIKKEIIEKGFMSVPSQICQCASCKEEIPKLKGFTPPPGSPIDMSKIRHLTKTDYKAMMKYLEDCNEIIEIIQSYKYKPEGTTIKKTPINPDPYLEDVITKKRKVPRGAWSVVIKGEARPHSKLTNDLITFIHKVVRLEKIK